MKFAGPGVVHSIHRTAMNTRIASVISVALCALLASCYPYDEGANRKKTKKSSPNATAPAAPAKTEAEKKAEEQKLKEMKKKQAATETTSADGTSATSADSAESAIKPTDQPAASSASTTTSPAQKPATTVKKPEYSYASKVPGKEGFVFSPYNNKVVDVRDIPSGTLVQDPTYPAAEKKYFRVP
jgi:ATPase subunit of ABC transporter with duplicated ATPase domains